MVLRSNSDERTVSGSNKLLHLEAVRGLAALSVVFWHCLNAFLPQFCSMKSSELPNWLYKLSYNPVSVVVYGTFSVRLFFVLSGYVLSLAYFRKKDKRVIVSSALRRYFRLMIPILGTVLIFWALLVFHCYYNHKAAALMSQPHNSWLDKKYNFHMSFWQAFKQGSYQTLFNGKVTLNTSLWTMKIEFFGSMIVFATLFVFGKFVWIRQAVYLTIITIVYRVSKDPYFVDFVAGLWLCDIHCRLIERNKNPNAPLWIGLPMVLTGMFLGGIRTKWLLMTFHMKHDITDFTAPLGALLIIMGVLASAQIQAFLVKRFFVFLGKISFPLYLIHQPLICSLAAWIYVILRKRAFSHAFSGWTASLILIGSTLLLAWALHYLLDKPAIAVGKWIDRQIMPKKRPVENN